MKLKLLVLLLLITFNADAQKIRITNPGNQWVTQFNDTLSGHGCNWRYSMFFSASFLQQEIKHY